MAKLYLIDGMSHIYRAYYAIKWLTNQDGLSTNAIYGFTVMLRKLIEEEEPDYLGVAIDLFGATVRHEQYASYKATRPKMPEDLVEQLPYIHRVCDAFGVPILSCEKYEADDVIGTLAHKAVEKGLEVVIVTIDKDLLQLVNEQVVVLDPRDMTRMDAVKVQEKWDVRPDQLVDMLSLVGDASDNIPGAPGIGEKGARGLIKEFGTLDNLLESADQVGRKSYRESIQNNRDLIVLSRDLVQIHSELPLDLDLDSLKLTEPDAKAVHALFVELNFASLLEDFSSVEEELSQETVVRSLSSVEQLNGMLPELEGKQIALAFWASQEGVLEGLALSKEKGKAVFVSGELIQSSPALLSSLFNVSAIWVLHNLKAFFLFCGRQELKVRGEFLDTMLMAYLLEPNKKDFSLEHLAREYLSRRLAKETGQRSLIDDDSPQELAERAEVTLQLSESFLKALDELGMGQLLREVEIPLTGVLARMESDGVKVDPELLREMSRELGQEIDRLTGVIYSIAGEEFNLNSPRQLSTVLFEKLNLPSVKKTGKAGHLSTGVEVLEGLAGSHEIARLILDYRELTKLKSTYLDALPRMIREDTGRIHTSYNQMVAATGRLSSSNPNLQNIPVRSELGRRVRQAFVPEKGFLILAADYSQIELRVMAHLSEDPVLLDAFRCGHDIHERTAQEVFGSSSGMDQREMRRRAKVINFGIIYGLSAFGLAKSLKISRKEAQDFIEEYFERYKGVQKWIESTLEQAAEEKIVKTLFGRIRQVPEINSKNRNTREFARRTAINAPIQGTAADLIKMAMVSIFRQLRKEDLKSRIILQVHDELVFEAEESEVPYLEELVRTEMEEVASLQVPLKVDLALGKSWYYAK